MYTNTPCEFYRQQGMTGMGTMQPGTQDMMGQQMPTMPMQQMQPMMPTMPMQQMQPMMQPMMPMMQPMMPMGTMGIPMGEAITEGLGTTTGTMPTNIATVPPAALIPSQDPVMDVQYTQGYLRTQIGRRVKVEFLIGTNMLVDREGTLVDVGISYIIINEVETDDLLLCDIYSIKFVRFYF